MTDRHEPGSLEDVDRLYLMDTEEEVALEDVPKLTRWQLTELVAEKDGKKWRPFRFVSHGDEVTVKDGVVYI